MADGLCCSGHTCGVWLRPASCRRERLQVGLRFLLGALFSLTQVTFQPFPLPSSALSSTQPMVGVGGQGGREGVPPPPQGSLNSLHPSSSNPVPPLHPYMPKRGWPVFCGEASAVSSCSQAVHKPQASLQHRLCLPAGGHSLSSLHQCALWTGSSPGSEEWLLPHPSPVGRKGRGVERGREVASAGGLVQAWPSTLPPFCLPSRPPFPLCPEARIGLFLPQPPPQFPNQRHCTPFSVLGALLSRFSNPWSLSPSSLCLHCPGSIQCFHWGQSPLG